MKAASTSKIIDIRHIYPNSSAFSKSVQAKAKYSVGLNAGHAVALIHPLYSRDYINISNKLVVWNPLTELINKSGFRGYIRKLESFLKKNERPVFIFSNNTASTVKWLNKLNTYSMMIMVPTGLSEPTPMIELINDSAFEGWGIFAGLAHALGITHLTVAGELAYNIGRKKHGCVYFANTILKNFFTTEITQELTFPNGEMKDETV